MTWLVLCVAATILVLVAARVCSAWVLALPTPADEAWQVPTADGYRVGLWRYRPRAAARTPPVVLCHGLGATHFNLDFDEELSVARFLARHGYDCFVLELRGSRGLKTAAGEPVQGSAAIRYDFDDHLRHDVPAALNRVREVTASERVLWVGHSMGGMLAYAMAGSELAARLHGFVAIGSPASFRPHRRRLRVVMRLGLWLLRRGLADEVTRWTAWLAGWVPLPGVGSIVNLKNMRGAVVRRALFNVVGRISRGQLEQFGDWILSDRLVSRDQVADYRERLATATVPVLLLAGSRDRLAPPAAVRVAFDRLGSTDKSMVVLGPESGTRADYGHGDLVLGRNAPEEVFERVRAWLDDHSELDRQVGDGYRLISY